MIRMSINSNEPNRMLERAERAAINLPQQALPLLAEITQEMLRAATPYDEWRDKNIGRHYTHPHAKDAIIKIVTVDEFKVGWNQKEIVTYLSTLNFGSTGSPNGWFIRPKKGPTGFLLWSADKGEQVYTNIPIVSINGREMYMARQVKHPYQKPMRFMEKTILALETKAVDIFLRQYNSLMGGS